MNEPVTPDVSAARCSYLDEGEFSLVGWIALQKSFHRQKALEYAFRVVHSVNPNAEIERIYSQLLEQRFPLRAGDVPLVPGDVGRLDLIVCGTSHCVTLLSPRVAPPEPRCAKRHAR